MLRGVDIPVRAHGTPEPIARTAGEVPHAVCERNSCVRSGEASSASNRIDSRASVIPFDPSFRFESANCWTETLCRSSGNNLHTRLHRRDHVARQSRGGERTNQPRRNSSSNEIPRSLSLMERSRIIESGMWIVMKLRLQQLIARPHSSDVTLV